MGAAGITILMVALLFGWEALVHFRRVQAQSSDSGTSTPGSSAPAGSGATATSPSTTPGSPTPPSSQPNSTGSVTRPGYQQATKQDIQYLIQRAQAVGIDPNAYLALVGWESDNFNVHAAGDNGKSLGLHQIYTAVWPITQACGFDAKCNTDFWWSNFGQRATALYNANGGLNAYRHDPITFLRQWVPSLQGSDPWSVQIAQTAMQRATAIRAQYGV